MRPNKVYLDTNVFMYAAGKPHSLKGPATSILRAVVDDRLNAVTSVETLQEIQHRYRHIGVPEVGFTMFDTLVQLMPGRIISVTLNDLVTARKVLQETPTLHAREAIHVGVALNHGISTVVSADKGFDAVEGVRWVPLHEWEFVLG